ncbi:MAG: hypothetical protein NC905_01110 [Candidatus Omnitrophica bacterium]|nr:hypothetical protein [Candidatus Omnitrophota bacterium]MCM8776852.1 hypothetical protein [Candidatus Omnitrophota bacterium]
MKKTGITFISVLVAFFILAVGILYLLRVYPVIDKLSGRSKRYIIASQIADKLFTLIEEVYGSPDGPPVPSSISGVDEKDPLFSYYVNIKEEKEGLYRVEIEITGKEEGRSENTYFTGSFRRR